MATFSCPKYDFDRGRCLRLDRPCRVGQAGCVLNGKAMVAVDAPPASRRRRRSASAEPGPAA